MEILLAREYAIVQDIIASGGKAYLVGGAVRDMVLGLPVKDKDIEIHGLTLGQTEEILARHGHVELVGKSFGVFKVAGLSTDWSLPRTDSSGRKPHVNVDPHMGIAAALRRRDLTINAMALDLATQDIIDPFHGKQDLHAGILRSPDPTFFTQDPLRFYRVMQFISRFSNHRVMQPDTELTQICKKMDIATISRERIEQEFDKLMLLSTRPSLGIRWLEKIGRLHEVLPELAATVGILQSAQWHPEGDVFEHTMQALDAAAELETEHRRELMYAVLCHDLGKVVSTHIAKGKIRSIGHDLTGVALARTLMKRITAHNALIDTVALLVEYHMAPAVFAQGNASDAAYKRLAFKLVKYTNIKTLSLVAYADKRGRNPERGNPLTVTLPDIDAFVAKAECLGVLYAPEAPVVEGADLLGRGVVAGPEIGKLLREAYNIQINEGVCDKKMLLHRIFKNKKE